MYSLIESTDIPYRNKLEPFINDHLENYLSPQNVSGNFWFVNANNTAGVESGKTWDNSFTNVTDAISAASDNDVIFIAPGDYLEGATVAITQDNLKLIGPGNINANSALIYNTTDYSAYDLLTINANNVEIAGLGFTTINDSSSAIRIATTVATYKTWIHDCRFDGYGAGVYAIHTGTTYDSPDVFVEGCEFRSWQTAALYCNATRGLYRNNLIHVPAAAIGFDRPDQVYIGNYILGANSTDTGIKITNAPSAGLYLIVENKIANCATTITGKTTNDAACILNYTGDASGGALIDPSP